MSGDVYGMIARLRCLVNHDQRAPFEKWDLEGFCEDCETAAAAAVEIEG